MKSALVTGATGFIGSNLFSKLEKKGVLTKGFSRDRGNFSGECIIGDLSDFNSVKKACEGVDAVFHLAGTSYPSHTEKYLQKDFESTVSGTLNLLEAARNCSVKKVVFASSAYVYGPPKSLPISESHPLLPDTFYGLNKLLAEEACRYYSKKGPECVIARIFNAFGAGQQNRVIPDLIKKAKTNSEYFEILGNAADSRDFLDVGQVSAALILLADNGANGEAYNIASGVETNILELAENILKAILRKDKYFKKKLKYQFDRNTARRNFADISKLKSIGFKAIPFNWGQLDEMMG